MEEWLSLFDDPILGNSALDRIANASFQIVIEGASYQGKIIAPPKTLGRQRRWLTCRKHSDITHVTPLPEWTIVRENAGLINLKIDTLDSIPRRNYQGLE